MIDLIISKTLCLDKKLINPQGNHFPEQAKIVYEIVEDANLDLEQLKNDITQHMSVYINNALPTKIFSEPSERKRMISVGGGEAVGCGGTHLPNTHYIDNFEIRQIKIKKK